MSTTNQIKFDSFPDLLRHLIDYYRINASKLARMAGMDNAQISRYLKGTNTPYPQTVNKLSKLFDSDIKKEGDQWVVTHPEQPNVVREATQLLSQYRQHASQLKDVPPGRDSAHALLQFLKTVIDEYLKRNQDE